MARGVKNARDTVSDRQLAVVNQIARLATQDLELRPMLQRIVDALRDGFAWEFVAFMSVDARNRRFVCEAVSSELPSEVTVGYSRELGSGVCGEVAMTGNPILIDDVREHEKYVETVGGVRSELCVPVRHGNEVLGVIDAESVRPGAFSDQLALLTTVADQVAGMVAGARMHQELARRAALLEMMSDISHTALQSDQLADVLARIVSFLLERFGLVNCSILLEGRSRSELIMRASAGDSNLNGQYGAVWPAARGIVGRAFRTGQPQWLPDVTRDPDYEMGNAAVVAEFVIPIRYHDRLLGVLNLESATLDSFTPENRNMLRALADQVAGAIHIASVNQRLLDSFQLVEEKSEQLERANEELRQANAKLERLSSLDGLTGIANRRQFDATLRTEWQRARRRSHPLAVLVIDIDHFKAYNDGYGHLAGDECLKQVAQVLADSVRRAEDLVARFGGEEFAVLLPEMAGPEALQFADELRLAVLRLKIPHRFSTVVGLVSVSIGAADLIPHGGVQPSQLVDMADKALYAAKLGGRNAVRSFQPPGAS